MNRLKRFLQHCPLLLSFVLLFMADLAVGQFPNNHDIYMVNVKTGEVSQVSRVPNAGEFNPSWSNNGKQIAHDVVGGPAPLGHAIYITDVQTGVSNLLVGAEGGNDASWSPNDQKIAFDLAPIGDASIYVLPPSGGVRTLVRSDAVYPRWSPNSKRLVFLQPSDGSIRTIDENGGTETFVTYGLDPVWSPNGKWIAFSDGTDIWKIQVNAFGEPNGLPVQVTADPAGDHRPSWSNNSKTIVFSSDRDGDADIWTVPASGGTPTKLTGLAGEGDYDPAYSNNGRFVAYAGFTNPTLPKAGIFNWLTIPSIFNLEQNYPNPFNPQTTIRYQLPKTTEVVLKIYNVFGQEVRTLVNTRQPAGVNSVMWDGRDQSGNEVSSGIYIYRLQAGEFIQSRKLSFVR